MASQRLASLLPPGYVGIGCAVELSAKGARGSLMKVVIRTVREMVDRTRYRDCTWPPQSQQDTMLTTPFLTDLDSRAAVKGSRDPLGIQQIWTRLGRHV